MHLQILSVLLFAALAISAVVPLEAPLPGYSVFIPEWEVQATPGGETLILNGTVEEVYSQLLEINPTYMEAFGLDFSKPMTDDVIGKNTEFTTAPVNCNGFDDATYKRIVQGINYLRGVEGNPRNDAGPANCGRISCSHNSGIYWCNDDTKPRTLDSFGAIADGVVRIIRGCWTGRKVLSGQAFHRDSWNVVVKFARC